MPRNLRLSRVKVALRIIIPLLILAGGWFTMTTLAANKVEPERRTRGRMSSPKVNATEIRRSDFPVIIRSNGVVRAHNSTTLTPQVSGRISRIDERFEDGAFFKAGDVLVELDPADFASAVASSHARVARAEAALAQEEALAAQALLDWKDLGYTDEPSDLVKRKPQLKEANADLAAAHADLASTQRDAERAKILAPYDGCVLRREVGPGQSVSPGSQLGEIFSTQFAEIRLPLSAPDLQHFVLPENDPEHKIKATIHDGLIQESPSSWSGTVVRTEGALSTASLELFVITRVLDPYGLVSDHPPLRIGQPVRAEIEGRTLNDVFVLPRQGMRGPSEIILVNPEDNTIQRTEVQPIWEDRDHVVVQDDLPDGWLLITSQLPYAANGSKVEIIDPSLEVEKLNAAQNPDSGKEKKGG